MPITNSLLKLWDVSVRLIKRRATLLRLSSTSKSLWRNTVLPTSSTSSAKSSERRLKRTVERTSTQKRAQPHARKETQSSRSATSQAQLRITLRASSAILVTPEATTIEPQRTWNWWRSLKPWRMRMKLSRSILSLVSFSKLTFTRNRHTN